MISISVIEDKFVRRITSSENVVYPLGKDEFVHFLLDDGTGLVVRKVKNRWRTEVVQEEDCSAYTIRKDAFSNSDVFESDAVLVSETVYNMEDGENCAV